MVAKRQCSFCAQEIEPGTGTMFVKRDGTVYQFCSSSCRKQQLHLGRLGHRFKWTRAYALKKAADRSSAAAAPSGAPARAPASRARTTPAPADGTVPKATTPAPVEAPAKSPRAKAPAKGSAPSEKPPAKRAPKPPKAKPEPASEAAPASDDA